MTPARPPDEVFCLTCGPGAALDRDPAAPLLRCPSCGAVTEVPALPLFVVTGASGAGKTTVTGLLPRLLPQCAVFEGDLINQVAALGWDLWRDTWLRVAHAVALSGRPTVLCTSLLPSQLESLPARKLLTQIWYPLAGRPSKSTSPAPGPLPVIGFAPGFMQCGGPYSDLLKYWASAGYVIVTTNFPHADCLTGAASTESDLLNEPYDMSYDLSRVLALSAARHGLLAGLLNPGEIGIAGQSDGGAVVAAILGNTCCTDHRVRAVAVESGDEWPPMAGQYFTRPTVPVLFSQGSADTINPPGCSVTMYLADRAPARYYLDLLGASHTEPYWGINRYEKITARVTLAFMDRYVLGEKDQAAVMARQGNSAGLAALYSGGAGGLTDTYCNT